VRCKFIYDPTKLTFGELVRFALKQRHNFGETLIIYALSNDERVAALVEVNNMKTANIAFQKDKASVQVQLISSSLSILEPDWIYDPNSALRQTPLRFVPLTDFQSTQVNCLIQIGLFNEATLLFSPRQGLILMVAIREAAGKKRFFKVVDVPILNAWVCVCGEEHPKEAEGLTDNESDDDQTIWNQILRRSQSACTDV
jgi:hypothetical protein